MKKALRTCIIAVLLMVLTIVAFSRIQTILSRKVSINRYGDLIYNNPQPDILFVGTSHVMDAVIPIKLWEDTGIRSYILCAEYNDMKRNIAMCELALQYCNPKVIVLDIDKYWEKSNFEDAFVGFHEYTDGFPLNIQKIKSTASVYGKSSETMEILFPIIRYHDRWKDLRRSDYKNKYGDSYGMMGYEFSSHEEVIERYNHIDASQAILYEGTDDREIERFILWCKERGIEVILTTVPYNASEDEQEALWGIEIIAQKYQVPYINMVSMYDLVDPSTDFKDEGHMNYLGAIKVTDYMRRYFVEHEILGSSATDETENFWSSERDKFYNFIEASAEEN